MSLIRSLAAGALVLVLLAPSLSSQAAAAPAPRERDILATAQKAGSFNTLVSLVHLAGLTNELKRGGPFTVFAPTDEAFAKLPAGTLEALKADRNALRNILLYHVVAGEVTAAQVVGLSSATTLQGGTISIQVNGGVVLNGTTNVIATDVFATNGVIHVIDSVLLPPQ